MAKRGWGVTRVVLSVRNPRPSTSTMGSIALSLDGILELSEPRAILELPWFVGQFRKDTWSSKGIVGRDSDGGGVGSNHGQHEPCQGAHVVDIEIEVGLCEAVALLVVCPCAPRRVRGTIRGIQNSGFME